MKTLSDPDVKEFLHETYSALAFHNQMPELYCSKSVDPGNYPQEMVDNCSEGAGGGNVRTFLCDPKGRIRSLTLGYWKKEKFLAELGHADDHAGWKEKHAGLRARESEPYRIAVQSLLIRSHEESIRDLGKPIKDVLKRIEEEVYTKGAIG